MENHQCMAFRHCPYCKTKYCDICEKSKHRCDLTCDNCRKRMNVLYETSCDSCGTKVCYNCSRRANNRYDFCINCFGNMVCKYCGLYNCQCEEIYPNNKCISCGKNNAAFKCAGGNENLCMKCLIKSDTCDDCGYVAYCPVIDDLWGHRCPECYNVFADNHLSMKNRLLTSLLCLSSSRLPKPIRLMICERLAEYKN